MLRLRIVSIRHDGVEIVESRGRPPLRCYFRDIFLVLVTFETLHAVGLRSTSGDV
jgi:hypothetical protein